MSDTKVPARQLANLAYEFDHRLNVRRAPLLSGQWLVLAECSCRGVMFDVVQGLVDDERVMLGLACRDRVVYVERSFFNPRGPQTALIKALSGSPRAVQPHGRAWTDPDVQGDPNLVTFDARLHPAPDTRMTVAAGVALTSGGWVRVSRVKGADNDEAVAQVHAAVTALALFPHGSSVTLLCPSDTVANVVRGVQQRSTTARFSWVPKPLATSLASYVDSREVRVVERLRASTALMRTATALVDECGEESWDASMSPLLDWIHTDGMPVTKPERPRPRLVERRRPRQGYFR